MSSRVSRTALAAALVVVSLSALAQTAPTRSAKLDQALEAIVPTPYAIELDRRVPRDWMVHWTPGAGNWMKVLQEALEPIGLVVQADWSKSVVRVYMAQPQAPAEPSAAQPRVRELEVSSSAPGESVPGPSVAPAGLSLSGGQPLGKQMREQGRKQGWTVVWELDRDWIVPADTTITAPFEKAVARAIEAIAADGVAIHATIYLDNQTIVISQQGMSK